MSKHINIIARSNGVGLDSDVHLLTSTLENAGYLVSFSHCRSRSWLTKWFYRKPQYDANIFLERVFPSWFGTSKTNILIPNQERFPKRHIKRLKNIDHVLCKSHHALEIFSEIGADTKYISFTSKDIHLNDEIPNYRQFFHLAGRSTLKGTDTILKLWRKHPEWPMLTIIQHKDKSPRNVPNNVRLITEYLPYEELIKLANKNGIHLCPSLSEGWGHYIVEAMSCAALVVTTDAPPMNELITNHRGVLVPSCKQESRHLGTNFYVDEHLLEEKIIELIKEDNDSKLLKATHAQEWFQKNHQEFTNNLKSVLSEIL